MEPQLIILESEHAVITITSTFTRKKGSVAI